MNSLRQYVGKKLEQIRVFCWVQQSVWAAKNRERSEIQRLFGLIYESEQQSLREGSLHPQGEEEAAGEQILRVTL